MITRKILVQGMVGQSDADKVNHAIHEVWGIRRAEVSLDQGEVTFSYDENAASLQDFQQAVIDCGFQIYTDGQVEEEKIDAASDHHELERGSADGENM